MEYQIFVDFLEQDKVTSYIGYSVINRLRIFLYKYATSRIKRVSHLNGPFNAFLNFVQTLGNQQSDNKDKSARRTVRNALSIN